MKPMAGRPWLGELELCTWDSQVSFSALQEEPRRGQPEPSPLQARLTSEADSQVICAERKQELFPFYFIVITNCVPQI